MGDLAPVHSRPPRCSNGTRKELKSYQPEMKGLDPETGDPQTSLENLKRILAEGPVIWKILVRPTGVLVLFDGGEQFYAPGLRVGTKGPATEALARIAAEARFGSYDRSSLVLPRPARRLVRGTAGLEPGHLTRVHPRQPEHLRRPLLWFEGAAKSLPKWSLVLSLLRREGYAEIRPIGDDLGPFHITARCALTKSLISTFALKSRNVK